MVYSHHFLFFIPITFLPCPCSPKNSWPLFLSILLVCTLTHSTPPPQTYKHRLLSPFSIACMYMPYRLTAMKIVFNLPDFWDFMNAMFLLYKRYHFIKNSWSSSIYILSLSPHLCWSLNHRCGLYAVEVSIKVKYTFYQISCH